jgi:pSer/pThr/pTyr-binding forkhead associated (FHA) protein
MASKADSPDTWPRIPGVGPALARLMLLESGKPGTPEKHEIPIGEFEITLGSDTTKAKVLLNYPLVSPLHARIFMDEEKKFRVADVNSTAGTWLNYAPVSSRGAHLEHGDVLQFGRASFRFDQLGVETKKLRVVRLPDEE